MYAINTIGVFNSTEESFFKKLTDNHIDLFIDIRQRRGVRGSQYKYVNSTYLQSKLKELGITYFYIKELAPTTEIREKQKEADKKNCETKKIRKTLGEVFKSEYCKQILEPYEIEELHKLIKDNGAQNIVLFCVEENASACHRSLVAEALAEHTNAPVINL